MSRNRRMSWASALGIVAPAALLIAIAPVLGGGGTGGAPCVVPDDGTGTVSLPPEGCEYLSPMDVHVILEHLPPGTTVELGPEHHFFFCDNPIPGTRHCGTPGGQLGGEVEQFHSTLTLHLNFTGMLGHVTRDIDIPVMCQTHTGPRMAGAPVQSFMTRMHFLDGTLPPGDPDFDLLRIKGGDGFGMPSPGHTTLTRMGPGGPYTVDSFFDIFYEIEFMGAMGGHIPGMGGTTMPRMIRMEAGAPPAVPGSTPLGLILIAALVIATGTMLLAWKKFSPSRVAV